MSGNPIADAPSIGYNGIFSTIASHCKYNFYCTLYIFFLFFLLNASVLNSAEDCAISYSRKGIPAQQRPKGHFCLWSMGPMDTFDFYVGSFPQHRASAHCKTQCESSLLCNSLCYNRYVMGFFFY